MRYTFTIGHDGQPYTCARDVEGKRILRQTIHVVAVGSKTDPADYGPKRHPASSMESVARVIAHEIVRETPA